MNGCDELRRVLAETVEESIAVKRRTLETCAETVEQVADALFDALQAGGKIMLCGNGGSAADAQHVAGEFVGRFLRGRRPLPAIALTLVASALAEGLLLAAGSHRNLFRGNTVRVTALSDRAMLCLSDADYNVFQGNHFPAGASVLARSAMETYNTIGGEFSY